MDLIEQIEEELEGCNCGFVRPYVYALYATLTISDLCTLYFKYASVPNTRKEIVKHIHSKIKNKIAHIPNSFTYNILQEFNCATGRERIAFGSTINELKYIFTKSQLTEYFDNQINSKKVSDRKRAYKVVSSIYDKDTEIKLWQAWKEYGDYNCIRTIVEHSPIEKIAQEFRSLCDDEIFDDYLKIDCIKKLALYDFSVISFLRDTEPTLYLRACLVAKVDVSDNYCENIIKKIDSVDNLGYALWCIGMLGKKSVLLSIKEQFTETDYLLY